MFDHLARCSDMKTEDADAACASREAFTSLLQRLAQVSAPNTGAASLLVALSRLARRPSEWVDGDLAIELLDGDDCTVVDVMTDLGAGMRERLLQPVRLRIPLSELTDALDADASHLAGALRVSRRSWKRVTLDATAPVRRSSRPPRISDTSLVAVRTPLPKPTPKRPSVTDEASIDAGWDE